MLGISITAEELLAFKEGPAAQSRPTSTYMQDATVVFYLHACRSGITFCHHKMLPVLPASSPITQDALCAQFIGNLNLKPHPHS